MAKQRIDSLLVEWDLAPSRNVAAAMVLAGEVSLKDTKATKPGQMVQVDADITVKARNRYVSRAGDKLESVVELLAIDFAGKVVLDVGSSTGGFTDCALRHGAQHVYCVDVGNNQLAYTLRQNSAITVMERTDIRSVADLPQKPDVVVIDVSFISLTKILEHVGSLLAPDGIIVAMAKPQFEAGKMIADAHKGLILDETVRQSVLADVRAWLADHFMILAEADSAVAGRKGNREHFFKLGKKVTS